MPIHDRRKAALQYARNGWSVFPVSTIKDGHCSCRDGKKCERPGKHPLTKNGVKDATRDAGKINGWWEKWSDANIGIATGSASGFFAVDIDGPRGKASLRALEARHGALPKTVTVKTGRGRHYYFRCGAVGVRNRAGHPGPGIDIRGDGGYVIGPTSTHVSGVTYRFIEERGPGEIEVAPAPKWLLEAVASNRESKPENEPAKLIPVPAAKLNRARAYAEAARTQELGRVRKAPNHQRNNTLNIAAFKLGQLLPYDILSEREVVDDLVNAAREVGLHEGEIQATIESGLTAGRRNPRRLPFVNKRRSLPTVEPPKESADQLAKQLAKLGETDTDNAQRFAERFGANVIYVPGRGWLVYDGKRWRPDGLLRVNELAKEAARLIAREANYLDGDSATARSKFAKHALAKGSLDRMLELAKSLLAVEDNKLDADPWLLNVENGTIDLRTGRRENHDQRDLLTRIAPVHFNRKAKCRQFKKFLRRITGDDSDLRCFIQKATGYSLTGSISEQVLFFIYGKSGNNGKSTIVNLLRDMLGDYGCHTITETLLVKQYDNNIPADVARLAGVRMVTAIEANAKRHLDEAKIKGMTGGEPITARFMRQNFFEYLPEFKIWLVANDRPHVRGTDDAFWRRARVIPLNIKIPEIEVNKNLPERLRTELPGILAWAVRGCLKWQTEGLDSPKSVREATSDWQRDMDHLGKFFNEVLIVGDGPKVPASELFSRYQAWCSLNAETALKIQDFKATLQEKYDVTHTRVKGRSYWRGVRFQ
jgi:putative DNA primase/helicase